MTIAIQLVAGNFSYVTATDTQVTYDSIGAKVDTGKIRSACRANPLGSINVAGAGDVPYITTVSQDIVKRFQKFKGTPDELESEIRTTVQEFYQTHVLPLVGRLDDDNLPDYSLLIAARHESATKLWNVEGMLFRDSDPFECIGIGESVATGLLSRLYPRYPTLESVAILAAYVIYRVKSSVDGCGLKTEIRFIFKDRVGMVPFDLIDKWESLFHKYDSLEREVFYTSMNFDGRPPAPPLAMQQAIEQSGHHYDYEQATPPQMRPLPEIIKDLEAMRLEFSCPFGKAA